MKNEMLEYFTLDNGLRCVLFKKDEIPIVNITVAYKVGSKDEKLDKKGMAHLFEHLMFEGSKHLAKGEFDRICSSIGGSNNAYTSSDITLYYMNIPSSKLEIGFILEAERMFNFMISQEALDNQKFVVIEEINQTVYDQPYGLYRDKIAELAYAPNCPYSWEVHGSIETVSSVTLDDVNDFRMTYYNPENAVLVISGNFNKDNVKKLINKYFNFKIQSKSSERNKVNKKDFIFDANSYFRDDVPFEATFIAYHCDGFINNFIHTSDLIAIILGLGKSSRLYKSLVTNLNIASQTGCYIDKKAYDSLIIFFAFANKKKISSEMLSTKITDEIKKLVKEGPTEAEIFKAKNILKANISDDLTNLTGTSDNLALFTLFYNNPWGVFDIPSRINHFDSGDIMNDLNMIFKDKNGIRVDAKLS